MLWCCINLSKSYSDQWLQALGSWDWERILLLVEQPVRSLGKLCEVICLTYAWLPPSSNSSPKAWCLPIKFKVWCYQFNIYNHSMWPLNVWNHQLDSSEDTLSYICKWLGLSLILSSIGLFWETHFSCLWSRSPVTTDRRRRGLGDSRETHQQY